MRSLTTMTLRRWSLLLLLILCRQQVMAGAEIVQTHPYCQGGYLRLDIQARDLLDERTASTIESGLPGTCLYTFVLEEQGGDVVAERYLELNLRLDLWENKYVLQGIGIRSEYPNLAAADSSWSDLQGIEICPLSELKENESYRFRIQVAVQPLAAEDRARLSRYVSGRSSREREEVTLDLGAVVGRLLAGAGSVEDQSRHTGPYFRPVILESRQ